MSDPAAGSPASPDASDLCGLGYRQQLRRSMDGFASFAVAFSMTSVTSAVFFLFGTPFTAIGGIGVWLFLPGLAGVALIALTYAAHLGAPIPLTGYAYPWNSRLASPAFGCFSGWTALPALFSGTASIGTALGGDVLQGVVFVAIFSCLLANMTVATRMTYSMARDNMLPGSHYLKFVSLRTRTPISAIILVAVVAFAVNLLSQGIANNVVAIVSVCYHGTYALTLSAVLLAAARGRIPDGLPAGLSLGRRLRPVATAGLLYALLIVVDMVVPQSGHTAAEYFAGAEILGVVWYVASARSRLQQGNAGPSALGHENRSSTSSMTAATLRNPPPG